MIDARYRDQRPTMVISNLGFGTLPGLLGDRLYDRLREGTGDPLICAWDSFRGNL